MSSLDKIFDHLASGRHRKEKTGLEEGLKFSWNSTRTQHEIPSLLRSWIMEVKK
ncbi:MAG: hypothetical protein ACRD4J_07535 [Nitrososphaeraceae archaeon]